ncbi:MAG: DedA family protein [Candidatus Kapaibacterium sp.]
MIDQNIEHLIGVLQSFPWWVVLLVTFANSYIENILPLAPSDVILVFIGTLVGVGAIDFPSAVVASTLGSSTGFLTMFLIGRSLDRRVVESGRYRFIPVKSIHTVEAWFRRYGYAVVVVNRFLSGTRAVIAVLAGMSDLETVRCTIASTISGLVWNCLILYAGMSLGSNWRSVESIMTTYSRVIGVLTLAFAAMLFLRWLLRRHKKVAKE